jgi:hypothetical protein
MKIASGHLVMSFLLSFFQRAQMTFDISFPKSLDILDSESELEELELLLLGTGLGGSTTLLGRLLPLASIVLTLGIEPLPDYSLCGRGGRLYSDSVSSLFRRGILPCQACCSRMLSIMEVISISL